MQREKAWRASCTLEASLLMGPILAVLVLVMEMGFLLHDKAFAKCAAYEMAVCASLRADEKGQNLTETAEKLIGGRFLGTGKAACQVSCDKKNVVASCSGVFSLPGMIRLFCGETAVTVQTEVELTTERPSRRIQKIRGILKIADTVRGKRD